MSWNNLFTHPVLINSKVNLLIQELVLEQELTQSYSLQRGNNWRLLTWCWRVLLVQWRVVLEVSWLPRLLLVDHHQCLIK